MTIYYPKRSSCTQGLILFYLGHSFREEVTLFFSNVPRALLLNLNHEKTPPINFNPMVFSNFNRGKRCIPVTKGCVELDDRMHQSPLLPSPTVFLSPPVC